MKKLFILLFAVAFIFTACEKNKGEQPDPVVSTADVSFVIQQTNFENLKSTAEDVPLCSEMPWSYVKFTLGGVEYVSDVLLVEGELLTQVVKLPIGSYQLTNFLVYNDVLPAGPGSEDILIRAAPAINSIYWDLMVNPLNLDITVDSFIKKQVIIDVLCFEDLYYEAFGFTWFEMNDIKIERQCFFGDVCTGKISDFAGSLYEGQLSGLQMDMPAIFYIDVYKEDQLIRTFSNEEWLGEGQCLEVYWANDLNLEENFSFAINVLLPHGEGMAYALIDSISFLDDNCPDPGEDGVVDFTVGNCNIDGADLVYPAWMDLPSGLFTMRLESQYGPSTYGTYVGIGLSGIPSGFDIYDGQFAGWCAESGTDIQLNHDYTVEAINSIHGPYPVTFHLDQVDLNILNYFFNRLQETAVGQGAFSYATPENYWVTIQDVIWHITNNKALPAGLATTMYADASGTLGQNFAPKPGDWACILFYPEDEEEVIQTMFIVVDP